MKRYIAAVDPDIHASGVAVWDRQEKEWVSVSKIPVEDTIAAFQHMNRDEIIFYVEAGWKKQKANFRRGFKSSVSETMAMLVGQNHAVSKITARMLKKAGFEVVEIAPLKKGFLKNEKGWTPAGRKHINEHCGYKGRINDDMRDSILIVMNFR